MKKTEKAKRIKAKDDALKECAKQLREMGADAHAAMAERARRE